jgi:beta-N-acetylhexosaminidase
MLAAAALLLAGACLLGRAIAAPEKEGADLDVMIGQMIMVGFAGTEVSDADVATVRDQLGDGTIGGVVLYPENIRSPQQITALTAFLHNARSAPVPFIAVDQEGGKVQRLSRENGHAYFPSARDVGQNPSFASAESAFKLYAAMAKELADSGFNLNFGPVVDLSLNPWNTVIARRKRSYGADPGTVTSLARPFIAAHREANVVTVAKHFPGHGSSWSDSHKSLPDISRSWQESELEPYVALAHDGLLDMVMVGHLYHPRFSDGEKLPSSLSASAIKALRAEDYIGFGGVVVSDDMEMGAVRDHYSLEDRVVRALNAGVDLLVFSNVKSRDTDLGVKLHEIVAAAVRDGRIPRVRIEAAYERIAALKHRLMAHDLAGRD